MTEENVKIFEENEIRIQYEETTQKYYYSIVDVISSITDTKNPRRYWSGIKSKIKTENNQLYENIVQLKLKAKDGKYYNTDVATPKQLLTIIKYVPLFNKEEFIQWLTTNELQQIDENKQLVQTLLYTGNEGAVTIEVIIDKLNETMWATQKTLSHLFKVDVRDVSYHLQKIFESGELDKNSVFQKIWITATDGKKYFSANFF